MRAWWLTGLLAIAACGGDETSPATAPSHSPPPVAGFLGYLPEGVSITVRLPTAQTVAERPEAFRALFRTLGWPQSPPVAFFGTEEAEGLAADRTPGLALTAAGGWVHYLPAQDKGALNRALQPLPRAVSLQERKRWIVLSKGSRGVGNFQEEPLPPGDLALRVRHHRLLSLLAQPGDLLEAGVDVGGGGIELRARLTPGENSPTREWLEEARPGEGGALDFIPSSLAVRIETTLPPTFLATFLTRRLKKHCGLEEAGDAVLLERFLREVCTGADRDAGLALGLEFKEGRLSVVALAKDAPGPPSTILAKLRRDDRSSFGALVLDRRGAPGGLCGWTAWVAQAEPLLDGLPEAAWPLLGSLAREEEGLLVAYAAYGGWSIVAAGPRADLLVRAVRGNLAYGARRSIGSFDLLAMRDRGEGDYVLGAVLAGQGFGGLPDEDRKALRTLFGAGESARAPEAFALAGFRRENILELHARLRYAP